MSKYICKRCFQEFSKKHNLDRHLNRKKPCRNINIEVNTDFELKSQLGQFYTTNYEYILKNMDIPKDIKYIIEPFAGNCDLLDFVQNKENYIIESYDIDPKNSDIIKRDTLKNPPCYENKFVITNPPYLARNKNKDKELYDKYNCNDLYKCFIISLIKDQCLGGIMIIPLNFMSSIRKSDIGLRKQFLEKYTINILNIFEEQVFNDTKYSVCSILFKKRLYTDVGIITAYIYPSNRTIEIILADKNNFTIGGEIYNLPFNTEYKVQRATRVSKENITNILLKCIDDNVDSQLEFRFVNDDERYIDNTAKLSARSYATLTINKTLSSEEQKNLIKKMNAYIQEQRIKYNSLFLSNYRESNTIARKRISFELAFKICNYILSL